ncbi:Hypothetical protein SCF082_LOCUS806 [Durusdinium trenchii]|uniref:Cellulase n=1 Tax=Durusdinium trenchii TaxID=1381693 RepID=A0ABP0HA01_9DINO
MHNSRCCDPTTTCYAKDDAVAVCLHSCTPGIHMNDLPQYRTPWTCKVIGRNTPVPSPPAPAAPASDGKCVPSYTVNCVPAEKRNGLLRGRGRGDLPSQLCSWNPSERPTTVANTLELRVDAGQDPRVSGGFDATTASRPTPIAPSPGPLVTALQQPSDGTLCRKGGMRGRDVVDVNLMEFYMYRAQNDEDYPLGNDNTGNLEGIMWYLQNEVLSGVYGPGAKFGITRIMRFRVQVRATQPLLDKGMNFGIRVAFDSGKCTGPDCDMDWQDYGYNVGCNNLGEWPFPTYDTHFDGGIWYSLPGACPSLSYLEKSGDKACERVQPGGKCFGIPTGTGDCTWNYENAGELRLTEPGWELYTDQEAFWSGNSRETNARKVAVARRLFAEKYGPDPPVPPCDFNKARIYG